MQPRVVHRVNAGELNQFKKGLIENVRSNCGKIWAPTKFRVFVGMERCPDCFPPAPRYAIAA